MYDDGDDDLEPMLRRDPLDPLVVAGSLVVLATVAERAIQGWTFWDQFDDLYSSGDRLRTIATLLSPYSAVIVLVGVTIVRLRSLLGDGGPVDRTTVRALQLCGAVSVLLAAASTIAAVDLVFYDFDDMIRFGERWQGVAQYVIAAIVAVASAWMAAGGLPTGRHDHGYDDIDPHDPYAPELQDLTAPDPYRTYGE
jgi:hypothetical protein